MSLNRARPWRRVMGVFGTCAVLGALAADGASSWDTSAGAQSLTLTVASSAAGLSPDFSTYTQLELMTYDDAVYDFPMHLNPYTNALEPWAVTSWSYDSTKTILTLNLQRHEVHQQHARQCRRRRCQLRAADQARGRASFDYTNSQRSTPQAPIRS